MLDYSIRDKFWKRWILSNIYGTYSISTISLTNISRWDSLFSILIDKRYNLLGKIWEIIELDDKKYEIDTNDFGDVIHPSGYKYIYYFRNEREVEFYYNIGSTILKKEINLDRERNVLTIKYNIFTDKNSKLRIIPLLQMREAQDLNEERYNAIDVISTKDYISFKKGFLELFSDNPDKFNQGKDTYYNFHYIEDEENGYNSYENLYSPGFYEFSDFKTVQLSFWVNFGFNKINYKLRMGKSRYIPEIIFDDSDLFVNENNIIAGFPWFDYWSRDTFISIPGLLLTKGGFDIAKNILINWMKKYPDGRIPNRWGGEIYPSDSPLWMIYAIKKYIDYTNDMPFIYKSIDYIRTVLDNYISGYENIKLDKYFIYSPPGRTWMDAACDGKSITPREGKPIEVNALWYNSLKIFQELLTRINQKMPDDYQNLAEGYIDNFKLKFIDNNKIKDVAEPDDFSVRPNFLIATFLPYESFMNIKPFQGLIEKLLTPYGLRSLSNDDDRFIGIYSGNRCEKDMAYHNGSVWPWLIGPYITTMVRNGYKREELASYFRPVLSLRYLPEIFDGLMPGIPRGAYAQAWSYAEIIRAFKEDIES